jgi:methionyl-tRNA formyltransferase
LTRAVVVTDRDSWFVPFARRLVARTKRFGDAVLLFDAEEIPATTDVAFMLSYPRVVRAELLARSRHNVVVHASDLPEGRGWSPLAWQILEGRDMITLTLFEVTEKVDSGPYYSKETMRFEGGELLREMQSSLGRKIVEMCVAFLADANLERTARPQTGNPSWYRRRTPADSELDPKKSIAEQFELLRVVDNERYPAFFEYRGRRYTVKIEEVEK